MKTPFPVNLSRANQSKQEIERNFFKTSNYESHKNVNPIHVLGTCTWFLEHPTYIRWRDSDQCNLLWLSADPGCGKSVLSRALIDEKLIGGDSASTCYFFFKDNEEQNSASTALCALLHQIFSNKQLFSKCAIPVIENNGERLKIEFEGLWRLLEEVAADPETGNLVCILDALDECKKIDRDKLIKQLEEFYTASVSHSREGSSLKFLVTSRPYPEIEARFFKLTKRIPTIRLAGEDESDAISKEINVVIKAKIKEIGEELGLSETTQASLEKRLLIIPHRTYLWLRLIWDELANALSKTEKKLLKVIEELPKTVEEAYEVLLGKCINEEAARRVLHIILAAQRPLTLSEMDVALEIQTHSKSYEDLDLEGPKSIKTYLRKLCGLFVSIVDSKIYLIHQTAKEFLVRQYHNEFEPGRWKHSLAPQESHKVLAEICITHLFFDEFSKNPFSSLDMTRLIPKSRFQEIRKHKHEIRRYSAKHVFLDYSASHWVTHFREMSTDQGDHLINLASKLCETGVGDPPTWFEVCWTSDTDDIYDRELQFLIKSLRTAKGPVDKIWALYWATANGLREAMQILLENGADPNAQYGYYGNTLQVAASHGHEKVVELLLQAKADVNAQGGCYGNALKAAAARGHEKVVELLIQAKADVDAQGEYGNALQAAARGGYEEVVELLMQANADVNAQGGLYGNALQAAARGGYEKVVELLIQANADVNAQGGLYDNALQAAVEGGHEKVVELLLQVNADVNAQSGYNVGNALQAAAAGGHGKVVERLLDSMADVDAKAKGKALQLAVDIGHRSTKRQLLERLSQKLEEDTFMRLLKQAYPAAVFRFERISTTRGRFYVDGFWYYVKSNSCKILR
jgi:ankyrin repeat protein